MYIDCIVAGFVWYIVTRMFFYKGNSFVGVNGGGGGGGGNGNKAHNCASFSTTHLASLIYRVLTIDFWLRKRIMKRSKYTGGLDDSRASSLNKNNTDISIKQPIKLHDRYWGKQIIFYNFALEYWPILRFCFFDILLQIIHSKSI